jgi:exosortase
MADSLPQPGATKLSAAGHTLALQWMRAEPWSAALVGMLLATVAIFYAGVPIFPVAASSLRLTTLGWARLAWNPETHYEHGPLVPFIALFLVWNALPKLEGVRPAPSNWGLLPLVFGLCLFLVSVRSLQARLALAALPFLLIGLILFAFGKRYARVLLFPVACLFFLIPLPGIDQATVRLQLMVTQAANLICNVVGIHLMAVGTTLRAVDQSFTFEIAGGCSGINSLMAITLMTAVFAHLTQDRFWKQIVLFAASVPVAIIGNIARLVAIMIVAKCFGQEIAGGWFHEISAYVVSFPFAFGALCVVNKILNWTPSPHSPAPPRQTRPDFPDSLSAKAVPYDY